MAIIFIQINLAEELSKLYGKQQRRVEGTGRTELKPGSILLLLEETWKISFFELQSM